MKTTLMGMMVVPMMALGGVIFTDNFEGTNTAWRGGANEFTYQAGAGEKKTTALVWERKEPKEGWTFYNHDFTGKVGHVYRMKIKAQSTEDIIGRVYVRLTSKDTKTKKQNFYINGMPIINNGWKKNHVGWWTEISSATQPLPAGGTDCSIEIAVMGRTTGKVSFDNLVLEEGEKRVFNYVTTSAYRDTAAKGKVRFSASYQLDPRDADGGVKGIFVVKGADGKPLELNGTFEDDTFFWAETDVTKLALGKQDVRAELRLRTDSSVLESASTSFTRVTADDTTPLARFDERGRFYVEGKPFFPLGCYGCGKDDPERELYATAGFNCFLSGTPADVNYMTARGIKAIIPTGSNTTRMERVVKQFATNRQVIAWYTADELPVGFAQQLRDARDYLHRCDPNRPAFIVLDQPKHSRDHLAGYDVIGTDPYPVGNNAPLAITATYPETVQASTVGMRPVWQVPQAFDWHWHRRNFRYDMKEHHFPNKEEFILMSWLPIACGVTGLVWYDFSWFMKDIPKEEYEATWGYFKGTVQKLAAHTQVFLSDEPVDQPKTNAGKIRARAWKIGTTRWVLVCNSSPDKVICRIEGDYPGAMTAIEGAVPVREGSGLIYTFAPHGVSFVKFAR